MDTGVTSLQADVVVVGGGVAGVSAALGAAEAGAEVILVERYGFLGGAATNSSVLTYCGFFDQNHEQVVRGVGERFLEGLRARRLYTTRVMPESGNKVVLLDQETTKIVFDEMTALPHLTVLLHGTVTSADSRDGVVHRVGVSHRGGRVEVEASAFVDASGDGALLHAAGAETDVADIAERQASTQVIRAGAVRRDADVSAAGMAAAVRRYEAETGTALGRASGIAARLPVTDEVLLLLADQQRDVLDIRELTRAERESRRLAWCYLDAFRRHLDGWRDAHLTTTGPQIGIRESRRMVGRERVEARDVAGARKRTGDGVARAGWPMEAHVRPGHTDYGAIAGHGWYHIPYAALRSVNFDNLFGAGRLTSSDGRAYASLRVMGTSFATGHAAGVAAALHLDAEAEECSRTRAELQRQGALV